MRSSSEVPFTIKAFGNDRSCHDVAGLEKTLRAEYADQSVAIHYRSGRTGLTKVLFVDVDVAAVRQSYGERPVVDFSQLACDAQQ